MNIVAEAPAAAAGPEGSAPPKSKLSLDLIVVLLNTLALAGAMGMLVYTKILFKRPAITEEAERDRLASMHEKAHAPLTPGAVTFEPFTANIEPSPARPAGVDAAGQQIRGRLHYATMAFSLELRDGSRAGDIEELRPRIMDTMLKILGHKNFNELSSAQGRYLLRTQIVEAINRLVARYEAPEGGETKEPARSAAAAAGSRESASERPAAGAEASGDAVVGEGEYPIREGLVTNVYFNQFVVQ